MSLETKKAKAEKLEIDLSKIEGEITEEKLDVLIEQKMTQINQDKEEERIRKDADRKAAEEARKNQVILQDIDGADVEQSEYFWPRKSDEKTHDGKILKATKQTASPYFNKQCGMPVVREDMKEVFLEFFPRRKGFLFYKRLDCELYIVIVPLKYAKTINSSNESQPGDFQRHALSFITEGSVNLDSLKLKLKRISGHSSISTEPLA